MKTTLKQLTSAMIMLLASATSYALPIVLPNPTTSASESGTFKVSAKDEITVTGSPVSLTTTMPTSGDIASGSARFMSGDLQYNDSNSNVDGKIAKVTFGKQVINNQVIYILKGLIYGTLSQAGQLVDVNGNFSVSTKPAPESTELSQAQVDSSHLVLTIRSNINNTVPAK
jgi:hypothetical protein